MVMLRKKKKENEGQAQIAQPIQSLKTKRQDTGNDGLLPQQGSSWDSCKHHQAFLVDSGLCFTLEKVGTESKKEWLYGMVVSCFISVKRSCCECLNQWTYKYERFAGLSTNRPVLNTYKYLLGLFKNRQLFGYGAYFLMKKSKLKLYLLSTS